MKILLVMLQVLLVISGTNGTEIVTNSSGSNSDSGSGGASTSAEDRHHVDPTAPETSVGYIGVAEVQLVKKLFNGSVPYNPLIRPAVDVKDIVKVKMGLSFIQLISVDERNQVMKSNVWLNIQWRDYQLTWNKSQYSNIEIIRMVPEHVWQPDIVLFNNADGKYEVSYKSRVLITHDGLVQYIPPAIYRSSCKIDVRWFPFDQQECELKFGSWTFSADQVDIDFSDNYRYVDLSDYVISGTWDIIDCPGVLRRFRGTYSTPNRTRIDFKIVLRRKTLFYTVNLIIPCVLISLLSICVFYLPADEGEKMTLSISILLALVVFLLLLQKILPPTSTSIPLIASYLLFTMILNVAAILITVFIINCSFRTPRTHRMPKWVYVLFIEKLSRILLMSGRPRQHNRHGMSPSERCQYDADVAAGRVFDPFGVEDRHLSNVIEATEYGSLIVNKSATKEEVEAAKRRFRERRRSSVPAISRTRRRSSAAPFRVPLERRGDPEEVVWMTFEEQLEQLLAEGNSEVLITREFYKSIKSIRYIAKHTRQADAHEAVLKDWKYIGLVMDRLLLIIFFLVTASGTIGIFINSPHIFSFVEQSEVIARLAKIKSDAIESTHTR